MAFINSFKSLSTSAVDSISTQILTKHVQLTERLTIMKLVKLFPKTDEALIGDEVHILINLNFAIATYSVDVLLVY